MKRRYILSSSFCPHYRCGAWAYMETETDTVTYGQLEQGYTSYYCEVTALIRALEHAIDGGIHNITVITANQSLCKRFHREWDHQFQVNYARKPPWDQIPQLLRAIDTEPTLLWSSANSIYEVEQGFIRCEAANQMVLCRSSLLEKLEDDSTNPN